MKNKISFSLAGAFILGIILLVNGFSSLPRIRPIADAEAATIPTKKTELPAQPIPVGPIIRSQTLELDKGDTLAGLLQNAGFDNVEVAFIIDEIGNIYDLRKVKAGQEIFVELEENNKTKQIRAIKFQPSIEEIIELKANSDGSFAAKTTKIPLEKITYKASGTISGSLYGSAQKAGVPQAVITQVIAAYSYVIDFQRDIKEGDQFEFLFEALKNKSGEIVKGNRTIYAKLILKGKPIEIFTVQNKDGSVGYYHADGSSVKKGLLRTPVDGARISSGFGMRKHPVLGYSKMHKGVDFAAPTGTPIYAAGAGVIEKLGQAGGYGNYISIKHNGTYSTAYAHISRFAKDMHAGKKVGQGQVIAYVGSTGRSTGPHLHFEVIKNGEQINPTNAKFQIVDKLGGEKLRQFNADKNKIYSQLKTAPVATKLASN